METAYEWVTEETDEDGDILDSDFSEKLSELSGPVSALVKRIGDEGNGEQERYYAYIVDGVLPAEFENDGGKVPKRYIKELQNQ